MSDESLPEVGISDYRRAIDDALDEAKHMVVVTSSRENVVSPWVEAEWGMFINEKRSGYKDGNLLTMIVGDVHPRDLPPSLRQYQVNSFHSDALEQLLRYVSR